jgi:SpoIID/LytB domain protein
MNIRIGFLHNRKYLKVKFNGSFIIEDSDGISMGRTEQEKEYEFVVGSSVPAEYRWYEKIQTVPELNKLESYREKFYIDEISTKIVKVGRKIGDSDNFEYWLLKRSADMEGKVYPSGDYRYKKVINREADGEIRFEGRTYRKKIVFIPESSDSCFIVKDVRVGIDFHWDHSEDLEYCGILEVMIDSVGDITAVNIIELEEYIASVNSSEMRNDNNIEMLKAQTVAARSTVLATMGKHHFSDGFDLCADDHCQCYQGRKKISDLSLRVAEETKGEVLMFDSRFVDARYSKICGGITERYSACWEDMDFPYLASVKDNSAGDEIFCVPGEEEAERFISDGNYDCFCNTKKHKLPASLSFCNDLFRWERNISAGEIAENLRKKLGTDIGDLKEFAILERGRSGRIIRIELKGTKKSVIIEKELNVRRLLSDTHLPSSAFYFRLEGENYKLTGAGWGHGVGLCQIGAQIMGESGYGYIQILKHYYRGAAVKKMGGK